jgi:cytochrome c-type biogenesis protein CcmH
MVVFWIITAALALVVAGLLIAAMIRGHVGAEPPAAYDLRVYRDQLSEVDRDVARGVISAEDAVRVRVEISRRILAADAEVQAAGDGTTQPAAMSWLIGGLAMVLLMGGSLALYARLGAPGYGDLALVDRLAEARVAYENRPTQAEAEQQVPPRPPLTPPSPDFMRLMSELRAAVASRPDDLQGYMLLARNEASLGDFNAAHHAQAQVVRIKGSQAAAQDHVLLADMMIMAAGGYISPEAEVALNGALALDPRNGVARYYMGLMAAQNGRTDRTFQVWQQLLAEGPADAPWIAPIRRQIEAAAAQAGVEFELPEAEDDTLGGPDAGAIAAASEMNPEDRQEMIKGMVAQLSDRLASEGGSPAEWARLIGAYGVLGETDRAGEIWAEAQAVFADNAAALEEVRAAAVRAGVAE